jgi:hypothetical protein
VFLVTRELLHLRSERGSVLVFFALLLPALLLVLGFAVDVGNWFTHHRHLQMQADAAALAGGAYFGDCFDPSKAATANTTIEDKATEYAGNASSAYNPQVGGGAARVTTLFNSKTFAAGGPGPDDTETNGPCQTPHLMLDVKQTEQDVPYILGGLIDLATGTVGVHVVPAINARARVQLKKATIVKGSLPLAVPDVDPKHVTVTLIREDTGATIAGPFDLTPGATVGGINTFTGPGSVTFNPAANQDGYKVGVRVGIGGQLGTCSVAAQQGGSGFTCFDYNTYNIGLVAIHVDGTGGTATRPATRVWTSTQCASTGSPFFSERDVISPATTCKAAVFAVMRNASDPVTTANTFNAIVDGNGLNNVSRPFTYSAADGYWSTGYVYDVPTDSAAYNVSLRWRTGSGGGAQSYDNVQRIYSASDGSGPIKIVAATSSAPSQSPYAAPASAIPYNFTFSIGIAGKLALSAPTETVMLRLTGGSRTTAVACDGTGANQFSDAIINGCQTPYQINDVGYCPDPAPPAGPADCVPLKTGEMAGPTEKALDDRFASCPPILWGLPGFDPDKDPRVVKLMITDFSAFNESGSVDVPVTNFAAFYVTGWTGSKCANNDPPPFDIKKGAIWGHFFKYVAPDPFSGGTDVCDPLSITPCIPVLVK